MTNTEELRDDLHRVVTNYPNLTVVQIVGILELVKADLFESLRICSHPDAQKQGDSATPDIP